MLPDKDYNQDNENGQLGVNAGLINKGNNSKKLAPIDPTELSEKGKEIAGFKTTVGTGGGGDAPEMSPKDGPERERGLERQNGMSKETGEENTKGLLNPLPEFQQSNRMFGYEVAEEEVTGIQNLKSMGKDEKHMKKVLDFHTQAYKKIEASFNLNTSEVLKNVLDFYKDNGRLHLLASSGLNKLGFFKDNDPVYKIYQQLYNVTNSYAIALRKWFLDNTGTEPEVVEKHKMETTTLTEDAVGLKDLVKDSLGDEIESTVEPYTDPYAKTPKIALDAASKTATILGGIESLVSETNPIYGLISSSAKLLNNATDLLDVASTLARLTKLKETVINGASSIKGKFKVESDQVVKIIDLAINNQNRRRIDTQGDAIGNTANIIGDALVLGGFTAPIGWAVKGVGLLAKSIWKLWKNTDSAHRIRVIQEQLEIDGSIRPGERDAWLSRMEMYKKNDAIIENKKGESVILDDKRKELPIKTFDPDPLKRALDERHVSKHLKGISKDHSWYEKFKLFGNKKNYDVSNSSVETYYNIYIDEQADFLFKNKDNALINTVLDTMGLTPKEEKGKMLPTKEAIIKKLK